MTNRRVRGKGLSFLVMSGKAKSEGWDDDPADPCLLVIDG